MPSQAPYAVSPGRVLAEGESNRQQPANSYDFMVMLQAAARAAAASRVPFWGHEDTRVANEQAKRDKVHARRRKAIAKASRRRNRG